MLYARIAEMVLNVTAHAGIQLDFSETVALQASRYDSVLVYAQQRPMRAKPYPESPPMMAIKATAGITALGADPHAAIPAGRLRTPAPTMPLIRLKINSVTVAPDSLSVEGELLLSPSSAGIAASEVMRTDVRWYFCSWSLLPWDDNRYPW